MNDNPTSVTGADNKKWCECVEACITCTAANGGTGERPTTPTINPAYSDAHGTCAPPPASWAPPPTAAPQPTPAPQTVFEPEHFICDAAATPGTIL